MTIASDNTQNGARSEGSGGGGGGGGGNTMRIGEEKKGWSEWVSEDSEEKKYGS